MKPKKSTPITQNPSGLPEGPSSTSAPSVPDQGPDVPRESAWDRNKEKILEAEKNWTPPELPEVASSPTLSEDDLEALNEPGDSSTDFQSLTREIAKEALKQGLPVERTSKPSLAQSILSRLSTRLPSKAPVVPRGTPILSGKAGGHSIASGE